MAQEIKHRHPNRVDIKNLDRVIQDIYKILNELENAVNRKSSTEGADVTGFRVIQETDKTYSVVFNSKDGLVKTATGMVERYNG